MTKVRFWQEKKSVSSPDVTRELEKIAECNSHLNEISLGKRDFSESANWDSLIRTNIELIISKYAFAGIGPDNPTNCDHPYIMPINPEEQNFNFCVCCKQYMKK